MKNILLASLFLFTVSVYGQVGINTQNPQGTFHIDGGKDNPITGAPDETQQKNDFIVTPVGRVGVRTVTPNSSLGVNGSVSFPVRYTTIDTPVVVTEDDQTIVIYGTGTAGIRLPAPSTCVGRIYTIVNLTNKEILYPGYPLAFWGLGTNRDNTIAPWSTEVIQSAFGGSLDNTTPWPMWVKLTGTGFYNKDGFLLGNRLVGVLDSLSFQDIQINANMTTDTGNSILSIVNGKGNIENNRVGIGVLGPQEKLDVNGAIKIGNKSSYTGVTHGAAAPVPDGGAGTIIFNGTGFFGWNGTSWRKLDNN